MNTKAYTVEIKNAAVGQGIGPFWKGLGRSLLWFVTSAPKTPSSSSGRRFSPLKTLLTIGGAGTAVTGGRHVINAIRERQGIAPEPDSYTKYRRALAELYPILNPALGATIGGIGGMAAAELMNKSPGAGFLIGALLGGGLGHYLSTEGGIDLDAARKLFRI